MNDIKASLSVGITLILLGAWLIRWHRAAWGRHRDSEAGDDRERRHYRLQFRRRIQVSALLILLGVMLPIGDWLMVQRRNPMWITIFWIAVLTLAVWIMLLAVVDWLERERDIRRAMQAVLGAGKLDEPAPAGAMIRVHVRVEHVRDRHALARGELDVSVDVGLVRVDDAGEPLAAAAEHVRRAAGLESVERSEQHAFTMPPASRALR